MISLNLPSENKNTGNPYFSILITQNCRKYVKFCYQLSKKIDYALLYRLEEFGIVEILSFKKYSPESNDTFKIVVEDEWQISGVLDDHSLHLIISKKSNLSFKKVIESQLIEWTVSEIRVG